MIILNTTKEKLEIYEDFIKESSYTLNLGEDGIASIITDKINGNLKMVIVNITGVDATGELQRFLQAKVTIASRKYSFVKILDTFIRGGSVFSPTIQNTGVEGYGYIIPSRELWALNDELVITAEGTKNAILTVVLRYV